MRYPVTGDLLTPDAQKLYHEYCREVGSTARATETILKLGLAEVTAGRKERAAKVAAAAKAAAAAEKKRAAKAEKDRLKQEAEERAAAESLAAKADALANPPKPEDTPEE